MDHAASQELLKDLLRSVSRSFYLTLRVLPRSIRPQISTAYLLARATDTIADTDAVPLERRLKKLEMYRDRILGRSRTQLVLDEFAAHAPATSSDSSPSAAERTLLARIEEVIALLFQFAAEDQTRIRDVVTTITSGQELDLRRFEGASTEDVRSLRTDAELDDYTWRVAGCVGEFWTHMCRSHLFPNAPIDDGIFLNNARRFGKGLQLVNILRDVPADLRRGRCYLPAESLFTIKLKPGDLLNPAAEPALRPLFNAYLGLAHDHLAAGWDYVQAIPPWFVRLRLACAWPILIGVKTLGRLQTEPILDPTHRVKVTRREVRNIIARSVMALPRAGAWNRLFQKASTAT